MRIKYLHASKFGNGAAVAGEFRTRMATRGGMRRFLKKLKPPAAQGWREKVEAFASLVATRAGEHAARPPRQSSAA